MYSAAEIMTSLMADDKPAVAKRCRNRGDRTRAVVPRGKKSGTNTSMLSTGNTQSSPARVGAEAERGGRRTRLKALDAVHHRARRTAEDEYISRAEEQPLERERLLPASLPNELRALAWVVGRK